MSAGNSKLTISSFKIQNIIHPSLKQTSIKQSFNTNKNHKKNSHLKLIPNIII